MKFQKTKMVTALSIAALSTMANASEWEGLYMGISAGESFLQSDWKAKEQLTATSPAVPMAFGSDPKHSFDNDAFTYGIFGGYNWDLGNNMIVGAELAYRRNSGGDKTSPIPGAGIPIFVGGPVPEQSAATSMKVENNWEASAVARLGYLVTPSVLVYGKGGVAFQQMEVKSSCVPFPAATANCNSKGPGQYQSDSTTQNGWTAGLGAEAQLNERFLARIEYSYADYGSFNYDALTSEPGGPGGKGAFGVNGRFENTSQAVTAGIAYRF